MLDWLSLDSGWELAVPDVDAGGLSVRRQVETLADGLRIDVSVVNSGSTDVALEYIKPLIIGAQAAWFDGDLENWAMWLQGHWMFSDTFTHRFGRNEQHEAFGEDFREQTESGVRFLSDGMIMLHDADTSRNLLVGFLSGARQFGEVVLATSADEAQFQGLEARTLIEGCTVPAGGELASEPLVVLSGTDPLALVERYAQLWGEAMKARVPATVPAGWCSWYYYYANVTENDILHNLAALKAGNWPVQYVQIDDGYEPYQGDWLTPNEKFPRGMKFLADEIKAAGYTPGLWLAPLVMHRDSKVLADHPEFAVRDHQGNIVWNLNPGPWAALDCTHPGARAWLRDVIRTMVDVWGYRFLKLDALDDASRPGAAYHVPGTTSAMNLRAGLELIREAAGDDVFLLGCSCPFYAAVGLVDAMRVGDDVAAVWDSALKPSVEMSQRLGLLRFWMHGRLWLNDPDCLIARTEVTNLTEDEVRFLAGSIALSGGLVGVTDDMATLPAERVALARRIFPATDRAARPLDLFVRETPALWHLPRADGGVVALLNWQDEPQDLRLDLAPLGLAAATTATERWSETPVTLLGGAVDQPGIPPHAARIVRLSLTGAVPKPGGQIMA